MVARAVVLTLVLIVVSRVSIMRRVIILLVGRGVAKGKIRLKSIGGKPEMELILTQGQDMKKGHSTLLALQNKAREVAGNHGMSLLMSHAEVMLDRVGYQDGVERIDVTGFSHRDEFHAWRMHLEN